MKVVFTGGHHTSALPVIKNLRKKDEDIQLSWIGRKYSSRKKDIKSLEYTDITKLGISFYSFRAGKFYKNYNPYAFFRIILGFIKAFFLLLKIKPDLIVSFGGYIAAPVVFMGWVLKIPSITHEQTVVTGFANKFIVKFADKVFISWDKSAKFFPKDKVIYSGLPLREEIFSPSSNDFNVNSNVPTIYVTGGKSGSHKINLAIADVLGKLLEFCNVIHQCGVYKKEDDKTILLNKYDLIVSSNSSNSNSGNNSNENRSKSNNIGSNARIRGRYFVQDFIHNRQIGEIFEKANLVVSRSGAHTVSELFMLEKPALLIPISWVSHNEQNKNAEILKESGLVRIVDENNLSGDILLTEIRNMLESLSKYKIKDGYKSKLYRNSSKKPEEIIADEILAYKKEK